MAQRLETWFLTVRLRVRFPPSSVCAHCWRVSNRTKQLSSAPAGLQPSTLLINDEFLIFVNYSTYCSKLFRLTPLLALYDRFCPSGTHQVEVTKLDSNARRLRQWLAPHAIRTTSAVSAEWRLLSLTSMVRIQSDVPDGSRKDGAGVVLSKKYAVSMCFDDNIVNPLGL